LQNAIGADARIDGCDQVQFYAGSDSGLAGDDSYSTEEKYAGSDSGLAGDDSYSTEEKVKIWFTKILV
jgi:hypothetical protein